MSNRFFCIGGIKMEDKMLWFDLLLEKDNSKEWHSSTVLCRSEDELWSVINRIIETTNYTKYIIVNVTEV